MRSPITRIVLVAAGLAVLLGLPYFDIQRNEREYQDIEAIDDLGFVAGDLGVVASSLDVYLFAYAADGKSSHLEDYSRAAAEAGRIRDELTRSPAVGRVGLENEVAEIGRLVDEMLVQANLFRDFLVRNGPTANRSEAQRPMIAAQRATRNALILFMPKVADVRRDGQESMASSFVQSEMLTLVLAVATAAFFAVYMTFQVRRMLQREHVAGQRLSEAQRRADYNSGVVSLASHELRSPLAVVKLTAEMIAFKATDDGDAEMGELAALLNGASRRAELLVAELLDLGRLDANRLQLASQPVDLRPLLTDIVAATIEFRGERPVDITGPAATARADPARLAIVLRNLVDNAFKYSPDDAAVRIEVAPAGGTVIVRVTDGGPGIPPADRERIFARFERLPQTQDIEGSGIGLHLSRELAVRMGGSLTMVAVEVGSCFEFRIPAASSSPAPK